MRVNKHAAQVAVYSRSERYNTMTTKKSEKVAAEYEELFMLALRNKWNVKQMVRHGLEFIATSSDRSKSLHVKECGSGLASRGMRHDEGKWRELARIDVEEFLK